MMNKKEITAFAKKIVRAQQGLKNHQLMHPRREWVIGVLVAVSIFSGSAVWSGIKYFQYQNIDPQATDQPETPIVVYRETLVNEALTSLEEKAQRLVNLLGDTQPVPEVVDEPVMTEEEEGEEGEPDTGSDLTLDSTDEEGEGEPGESTLTEEGVQEESQIDTSVQPATNI